MTALAEYRDLRKSGHLAEAAERLQSRMGELDAAALAQAGALLAKDLPKAYPEVKPLDVFLAGQCTTTFLAAPLTAWAWKQGLAVSVRSGEYDQMLQDLMRLEAPPDALILLPWHQRLFSGDRTTAARADDELAFLQQVWAQVARLKCKLVQVGYDWTGPGPLGFSLSARRSGSVSIIREANAALQAHLPAGAYFVDLETISGWHGRTGFYDDRNLRWLKQPFSQEGLSIVARHMATGLRCLTSGRKKVLVLDLDNTLWGGVVGETGPLGIGLGSTGEGEAFLAFQKHVRRLGQTGVLLAVSSKNNPEDARGPFEQNDQMALELSDFAAFEAAWDPKPAQLQRLAAQLNVGLDSFVFFDDNPVERAHVQAALPQVQVVDVPEDPALFIRALEESLAFESIDLTVADAARTGQYHAEAARKQAASEMVSPEHYLTSLEMQAAVQPITAANLDRVTDLITKTNQFNLTTRRHSRAVVEEMIAQPGSICFAVKLWDRFGDYGLISVLLAVPEGAGVLAIDTWLMSCRAMSRTVEHFVLNHLAALAKAAGYHVLRGEYLPTPKNTPVKSLLAEFGFAPNGASHVLQLGDFTPLPTQVQIGP